MSKMRVHELAKELGKTSKELIDILEKNNVEVKGHMSVLEEEDIQKVKAALAPKKKKKKNIIQVFNPQNSRMDGGPDERLRRQRPPKEGAQRKPRPDRPEGAAKRPVQAEGKRPVKAVPQTKPEPEKRIGNAEAKAVTPVAADSAAQTAKQAVQTETAKPVENGHTAARPVELKSAEAKNADVKPAEAKPSGSKASDMKAAENAAKNDAKNRQTPVNGASGVGAPKKENREGGQKRPQGERRNDRPQGEGSRRSDGVRSDNRSRGEGGRADSRSRNEGGRADNRSRNDGVRSDSRSRSEGGRGDGSRSDNRGGSRGYNNRSDDKSRGQGRNDGGRGDGSRGENRGDYRSGANRGGDNRASGRNNRGGKLVMPDRPTEAIERQTQKNERQTDRNNKREKKNGNNERDRFDKKQSKAGTRNLQKQVNKPAKPQPQEPKEEVVKTITLPELMTVRELADKMKVQPSVIVKKLFMQGTIVTVNQEIDFDTAEEIALEFNCIAEPEVKVDVIAELLKEDEENEADMVPRVPVVCVMGHVDHGKTSLLDAIRDTRVTDREAGGITQHIGASVVTCNGQKITFLDTPGHEAFTAMRMRGANSTDIAVLVVAADDGVMPQTVEAISHAKAAGVEIIVAVNKIDKPSANIEKVKQELTEYELVPEDWGGSTIFVPVSAKTHEGIDTLLEMILLTAEVLELKANPKRQARGLVIEGKLDKGKGPVANLLVQKGTLHVGDFIAAGACSGKVRAMMDDQGRRVKEAGPSMPVEVLGFNEVPGAGEIFVAPKTDKEAKSFAETFVSEGREKLLEDTKHRMSLDDLFTQIQAGSLKELDLIVKADVQGSVEAVKTSLQKLSNEEVVVKIIHGGVGAVNESDVVLASASNAIIIGFNVRPDAVAKATAEREGVDIRLYKVIYNAIEDVEAAMKGMLDPVYEEKVIGHAEVRQLFKASGVGTIAGAYVLDGVFQRGCSIRIKRGEDTVFDGALSSLKRFKDDVKEVKAGYECGLVVEKFNDIQEGDIYEAYVMVEVPR